MDGWITVEEMYETNSPFDPLVGTASMDNVFDDGGGGCSCCCTSCTSAASTG
jgi:hypothetical protein